MILTASTVLPYLLERRFVFPGEVVAGDYRVWPLARRNRNFRVQAGARGYFVKQAGEWNADFRRGIEIEASLYRQGALISGLQAHLPQCWSYDPAMSVLILEYLRGFKALDDEPSRFSVDIATNVGKLLAEMHASTRSLDFVADLTCDVPWIFHFNGFFDESRELSTGRLEMLRTLRRFPGFARALGALKNDWHPQCLIHADCKLANLLYKDAASSIKLVDWESMQRGDPLWDLATVLQSYWSFYVRAPASYRLASIRPALLALLRWYPFAAEDARRLFLFAGARMLQSAYELLDDEPRLTAASVRMMQASLNILQEPELAARTILGDDWQPSIWN